MINNYLCEAMQYNGIRGNNRQDLEFSKFKIFNKMEKEILKLTKKIIKVLPCFFDDLKNWQYGNGTDAGKDFEIIYKKAKKLNQKILKENSSCR